MPKGGTLKVETDVLNVDTAFIGAHGFGEKGRYVVVKIADTGIGFDETTMENIFDPFFTTKDMGTGLGLSIVYGIVKQHAGYVSVDSEPGRGTTFNIYLPAISENVQDAQDGHIADLAGDETILVAEDAAGVRGFMKDVLSLHGYTVITANDGQDAVEKFRQFYPFDLIILDMIMPRKDGWEAYEEIRKIDPEVAVLFTSGYTKDVLLSKGLEGKTFDLVPKPLALQNLLEKIRKALDSG